MRKTLSALSAALLLPLGLLAALPLLLPIDTIHEQVESQLALSLGRPVAVSELAFRWYPNPHLRTEHVTVQGSDGVALELHGLHLAVGLADAFRGQLALDRIKVGRLAVSTQELMAIAADRKPADGEVLSLTVHRIEVQELTLDPDDDSPLGPYRLRLELGAGTLDSMQLTSLDRTLHIGAVQRANAWELTVRARDWVLPVKTEVKLDSLDARARVSRSHMSVGDFSARAYGGVVRGTLALDWSQDWRAQGRLSIAGVDLGQLSSVLAIPALAGHIDANGKFALSGSRFDELMLRPTAEGEFVVSHGAFSAADTSGRKQGSAATQFERLSGTFLVGEPDPRTVTLRHLRLQLEPSWSFGPYDLHLAFDQHRKLDLLLLAEPDKSMQLELVPHDNGFRLLLRASQWTPPAGMEFELDALAATGYWTSSRIELEQVAARAFGGSAVGSASLAWGSHWKLDGQLRLSSLDLEQALGALDAQSMAGLLFGNIHLSAFTERPARLLERADIESDFVIVDGRLLKADLEAAVKFGRHSRGVKKGTRFSELSGNLKKEDAKIQLFDLSLLSHKLRAQGNIDIDANDVLSGQLDVSLNGTGGLVGIPLKISGTISDPTIRPTHEALAGAAAGTVVLGPGLGTALGAKVGQVTGKLGTLIKNIGRRRQAKKSQAP